jgi:hypothetical protein
MAATVKGINVMVKKTYMEHAAIRVKDIQWHIRFFKEALGMSIRNVEGPEDDPKQVWFFGGVQLVSDPGFEGPEGRSAHLGIMTEDLEASIEEVNRWGVTPYAAGAKLVCAAGRAGDRVDAGEGEFGCRGVGRPFQGIDFLFSSPPLPTRSNRGV